MRCIKYGYRLRGLEGTACPECGRGFDPANSKTYLRDCRPPLPRRLILEMSLMMPLVIAITAGILFLVTSAFPTLELSLPELPVLLACIVGVVALVPTVIIIAWWLIKRRKFRD